MYICESSVLSSDAMWLGIYTAKATSDVLQLLLLFIPDVTTEVLPCSGHDAGNFQCYNGSTLLPDILSTIASSTQCIQV